MLELSRRHFMVLSGAAATSAMIPRAFGATPRSIFPYGSHVYREPSLPLEQLTADLALLKRLGFSMIKIQESWSTDEKHQGTIDLSRVERVVADARQLGLLVYFGVTMEQAPMWLWKKYPDATMLYEDGSPHNDPTQYLLPSDAKPGPCWHHPDARAAATRFIEAVGRQIGRYDNIAVWNVWQELALTPYRPGHKYLCYCAHSLAAYRDWLRAKYTSLDELNARWRTGFGEWDEVEPPRFFTPLPSMIDWRVFMEDAYLSDVLRWKAAAFHRADPLKRPVLAHTGGSNIGSTADWAYARQLDVYGTSLYPGWGEPENVDASSSERIHDAMRPYDQLWGGVMMRIDYVRSASPTGKVWAAELQGGRAGGGPLPGRTPDAADIRRWVMGSLAAGARGICFWNHRNEIMWSETSGFGLLDRLGDSTARADEAGRLGRAIQTEAALFTEGAVPAAQVGIVMSECLFQFAAASDQLVKTQSAASNRGIYRALWEAGFPVDFVDGETMENPGRYKVLVVPAPISMSDTMAASLIAFVHSGGTLISEATPGRFDEYGFGRAEEMGPGLVKLFGAEHERLAAWVPEESHGLPPKTQPQSWPISGVGELDGKKCVGNLYLQSFHLQGAQPLLVHRDQVVGTTHTVGKGRAVLVGTLLGPAIADGVASDNDAVLSTLITAAGVKPDRVGKLLQRRRVLGKAQARFLINPTRETVNETVALDGGVSVTNLLGGALAVNGRQAHVEVGPLDIVCLVMR